MLAAIGLLIGGCAGPSGPIDLSDPGPSMPPATGGDGVDDDDLATDDDDLATDDDDLTDDDDDDDPDDPIAPCGAWIEPGPYTVPVSTSSGEALLTTMTDGSSWLGCEVQRHFDTDGVFVCELFWQVTGVRTGGALQGDVYRLDFTWVEGLSSCEQDGADFVLRYAVQPLPEQELNLYRSEPVGEPLWYWVTRGAWAQDETVLRISYRTGFVAWD